MRRSKLNLFTGMILAVALCTVFFSIAQGQSDWQYEPVLESEFVTVPNIDVEVLNEQYGLGIRSLSPSKLAIGNLDKEEGKEIIVAESCLPLIYIFRNGQIEYYLLEESLSQQRTFSIQPGIESIAVGDVNADGRDEIVVLVGSVGPSCSILVLSYLEGQIQVTWERHFDSHSGAQIGAIAIADLDGDGLTDLVTCGGAFYQDTALKFGGFTPFPGVYRAWGEGIEVKVDDLNGDDLVDVIRSFAEWGVPGEAGFEILFQEETGAFEDPIRYLVPYVNGGIAVGDVNNDGLNDIIVPEYKTEGHLVVFLQTSGGFQTPVVYVAYGNPASPLVTDINSDGLMDVVLLSWHRIACFYQNRNYRLNSFTLYNASVGRVKNQALQVDDLDGDGNLDLVCIGADDELLCIVMGLPRPTQIARVSASPSERYLPLLATYQTSHDYLLLSLRRLFSEESRRLVIDPNPCAIALGDVDGDGTKEIVVGDGKWPVVYVCDESTVSLYDLGVSPGWPGLVSLAVGDFNDDARDDLAVYIGDTRRGTVVILTQTSDGNLVRETVISADKPLGGLAVSDLNQDGLDDIVTAVGVYYQLPSHAFSEISLFSGDYAPPLTEIVDVEVSDLNSDGRLDVVRTFAYHAPSLYSEETSGFEILFQKLDESFEVPVSYSYKAPLRSRIEGAPGPINATTRAHIAVGDINHDGAEDVVLCVGGKLYVFAQDEISLKEPIEYGVLEYQKAPIIADINGDGLNDVVVCDGWDHVSALYQDEQGCLGSPATYTGSVVQHPGPEALGAGDIDGDGRADLVSVANYYYGVCIFPHCELVEPELHTEDDKIAYWQGVLAESTRPISQALALRKLGGIYLNRGMYEDAFECMEGSIKVSEEAGLGSWTGLSLNDEGIIYFLLGLYDRTFTCWEEALSLFNDLDYVFGQRVIYRNLGLLYFLQQDFTSALGCWSMCYKIDVLFNETLALAIERNNMAMVEALTDEHEQSLRSLGAALRWSREMQDELHEAVILGNFGMVYSMMEQYGHAMEAFYMALAVIEEASPQESGLFDTEIKWMIEFNIGLSYEERDQLGIAVSHYRKAITLIESMRQSLSHEVFKTAYQRKTGVVYQRLINLLYRMGEGISAFSYAERCRARTFLDALYQGSISPNQLISPEAGISSGAVDPIAIDQAVADARDSLQENEAVLEYMVTNTGVYLWVITKETISDPIFIKYERAQLMNDVITLRKSLESDPPDQITMIELLTSFYDKLVKKSLTELPDGVDTLIIIPSGPLWYLPFSALVMTDQELTVGPGATRHPYLVEKFTLAYLPSLASLSSLTKEETQAAGEPLLVLADPELSRDQLHEGTGSKCGEEELGRYEQLVVACQAFADLLVGKEQEEQCVYAGKEAQEVRAHEDTGKQVVVYAAHGQFNPYVPLQSKLLLALGGEATDLQTDSRVLDGNYHAWEALLTDYRGTELVILAACETLLPHLSNLQGTLAVLADQACDQVELTPQQLEQIVVGDEVVGLARAFLSSGAEAVLGTLWLANPDAIGKLLTSMADYYKNEGYTWVQALTKTQRELIKGNTFTNPWFWAPYQLIGRWR